MKRNCKLAFFVLLLTTALSAVAAHADTLTFTLSQPDQLLPPGTGGFLSFMGTITAPTSNTGLLYLTGDAFNIPAPLTLDDSGFFNNAPIDLAPGASYSGLFFTVDVPTNAAFISYMGSFSILGGPNQSTYNAVATQPFAVQVTPEPSSWLLMFTGLSGAALVYRRKSILAFQR